MEISLYDVMKMACRAYHDELKRRSFFEKGFKKMLFFNIIKKLFESFGRILGYNNNDFDAFFSDIILLKNREKNKTPKAKKLKMGHKENEEKYGLYYYTYSQVEEFGLNPDSYF